MLVNQAYIEHTGTASSKPELLSMGESQRFAEFEGVLGEAALAHPVFRLGTKLPLCTPSALLAIVPGQYQAENVTYEWATKALRQPEPGLHRQSYVCPITRHLHVWQQLREGKGLVVSCFAQQQSKGPYRQGRLYRIHTYGNGHNAF